MATYRHILSVAMIALVGMAMAVPLLSTGQLPSFAQQAYCLNFPETGKNVCGTFLAYWQQHGGLAQQGFPLSGEFQEQSDVNGKSYTVQYFERAVFEKHPENASPNDILLSLLGSMAYKQKYARGVAEVAPPPNFPAGMSFPETGKEIRGEFLTYWKGHGGLAQQGYPITNLIMEKSELDGKTYMVQYFERAVFEMHPENKPPYNVLLSQLGTLQYRRKYPAGASTPGIPTVTATATNGGNTSYPAYGHAPDYSWISGQLKQQGSCWIVVYVSPLSSIPPDQYNNQFTLVAGAGWNSAAVKDGQWVIVQGRAKPGTTAEPGCSAHGYLVSGLRTNPDANGSTR